MTSILFLTNDDFFIHQGARGSLLCNRIKGISFVLFYSLECQYCKDFLPIFKQLTRSVLGCQFGLVDISRNIELIRASQKTVCPIDVVPFLILYSDGKPYMRYKGTLNEQMIKKFVFDVSNKIVTDNRRHSPTLKAKSKNVPSSSSVASTTIGVPIYGDGNSVSYIKFNEYDKLTIKHRR